MDFVKGMYLDPIQTKYGEILKLNFNKAKFLENNFNEEGYLRTEIKRNKEGKPYAVISEYKGKKDE